MTRNRFCGWLWNFFLGVHNENYHLVHHLFPKIPEWEYDNVRHILMKDETYASLHRRLGWKNLMKEIIDVDEKQ
ncbi:unnamed protein product [Rotaria sp. Silwood2]|nr:unnamed protein product [Rotaria sp. Silwood2]CAF3098182.1 unnamed protein product [Rotaria sp. Silwood2]